MDGIVADRWNFIATHDGQWGVFEQPLTDATGNIEYVTGRPISAAARSAT